MSILAFPTLSPDIWKSGTSLQASRFPSLGFFFSWKGNWSEQTNTFFTRTWHVTAPVPPHLQTSDPRKHKQQTTQQPPLMPALGCILFIKRDGVRIFKQTGFTRVFKKKKKGSIQIKQKQIKQKAFKVSDMPIWGNKNCLKTNEIICMKTLFICCSNTKQSVAVWASSGYNDLTFYMNNWQVSSAWRKL